MEEIFTPWKCILRRMSTFCSMLLCTVHLKILQCWNNFFGDFTKISCDWVNFFKNLSLTVNSISAKKNPDPFFNEEIWCIQRRSFRTQLTFRKQELHSAQVPLAGCYHQQGPALLVTDVDICTMLQQQLGNLIKKTKTNNNTRTHKHMLRQVGCSRAGTSCAEGWWRSVTAPASVPAWRRRTEGRRPAGWPAAPRRPAPAGSRTPPSSRGRPLPSRLQGRTDRGTCTRDVRRCDPGVLIHGGKRGGLRWGDNREN